MRPCILLCSLLLLPFFAPAQAWNIVAKAGPLWNSASSQPATNQRSSPLSGLLAIGASRQYRSWEGGLTVGIYRYAYRIKGDFYYQPYPTASTMRTVHVNFTEPNAALVIMPFLNRHFDTGRLSWYVGAAPFYANFLGEDLHDRQADLSVATNGNAFGIELRGGGDYRLSEAMTAFAEPAIGWINMPGFYGRATMFTASLSLGCRFRLR